MGMLTPLAPIPTPKNTSNWAVISLGSRYHSMHILPPFLTGTWRSAWDQPSLGWAAPSATRSCAWRTRAIASYRCWCLAFCLWRREFSPCSFRRPRARTWRTRSMRAATRECLGKGLRKEEFDSSGQLQKIAGKSGSQKTKGRKASCLWWC